MKEAERERTTGKDGREEEKKLGDSSTAFACGKSVGIVRCKVNGPRLACPLDRGERWHRVLLSGFPYTCSFV